MRLLFIIGTVALTLSACGGGGDKPAVTEPEPDRGFRHDALHYVGSSDYIPADTSSFTPLFSAVDVDVYVGQEETDQGQWVDWYAHIATHNAGMFGIAFAPWNEAYLWAGGYIPQSSLAANPALSGSASWSGLLMGLGKVGGGELFSVVVGADADMTVNLSTLNGQLEFTNLQYWESVSQVVPNTGTVWGDGDLSYAISVTGNRFADTGGDAGTIGGAFFGPRHDGMGGTLERTDLIGSFGGSR